MTLKILGVDYSFKECSKQEDERLSTMDGYCDNYNKKIVIDKTEDVLHKKHVITHEIVHAFLNESGLNCPDTWATNEEVVDWIAAQLFKISKVVNEVFKEMK